MSPPGSVVTTTTVPHVNAPPTDTATAFIAMPFEKGPVTPQLLTGITGIAQYGADTAIAKGATYLEAFFRIGGKRVWVNRVVGPTPMLAGITLNGTGATASVRFTAKSYGTWGNALRLAVIAGTASNVKLQLSDASGILITSSDLADKAAVLAYTGLAAYGTLASAGVGTIPVVVAAANLTGGTGDEASITDTQRLAALTAFTAAKGPGQVLLPGDTRALAGSLLGAHAAAFNRRALFDLPDDSNASVVSAAALALRTDVNAGSIIAVAPWATAPAAVGGGTVRDLPYSIVQAAVIARQDLATKNPNQPAAGDKGIASWILGVKNTYTTTELDTLNDAGANIARDRYENGQITMMGNRTLTSPITNALYLLASNVRLDMLIQARGERIADRYVFAPVDGYGRMAARYGGELTDMLKALPEGALFAMLDPDSGQVIDPGYVVDTSPAVNTPETIAALQLRAVIGVRRAPAAELIFLEIVNQLTTEEF